MSSQAPDTPLTDAERRELTARYVAGMHAMQSATALEISHLGEKGAAADPKHLRVGVNSALVDSAALAQLLIAKGVITEREYLTAIAEGAERERERATRAARERCGLPDSVTFG